MKKGENCEKCNRFLTYEELNDLEVEELEKIGSFICSNCINKEMEQEQKGGSQK